MYSTFLFETTAGRTTFAASLTSFGYACADAAALNASTSENGKSFSENGNIYVVLYLCYTILL